MGAYAHEVEPLLDGDGDCCGCDVTGLFWDILPGILGALAAIVLLTPIFYFPFKWSYDNDKFPEYSVAVAGFSGLDPDRAAMDPTFDLTVRIKEPRRWSVACVERGTAAAVSYRGAPLARGPVPGFCGRAENTTEVGSVMAWGAAVPVPRFARERLAEELGRGEADVDVTLTAPARYCLNCLQMVIECKARLGRGEASPPCAVRHDLPTLPDDLAKRTPARRMMKSQQ
ncbi:hypothetical protein ACP4OV_006075 [Aristida adscensionis]